MAVPGSASSPSPDENNRATLGETSLRSDNLEIFDISLNPEIHLQDVVKLRKTVRKLVCIHRALLVIPDDVAELTLLEELDFSGSNLSSGLNSAVGRLLRLKKLVLSECGLAGVPDAIGNLKALEELDLSGNNFSSGLNPAVGRLLRLKKLVLSGCWLTNVPDAIGNLEALQELDLSLNNLCSTLNPAIGRLLRLVKLILSQSRLTGVPDAIGNLEALEELDMSGNNSFTGLNVVLSRLLRLKKLVLFVCSLTGVPDVIGKLVSLFELDLSKNNFSTGLNPAVGLLRRLKKLVLRRCCLSDIPDEIGNLEELEELDLLGNDFSSGLNAAVGRLFRLEKLLLSYCYLTDIPDTIGNLRALEELDLRGNNLSSGLNPAVGRLLRLKKLVLSECWLSGIPDAIGKLEALMYLDLRFNNLDQYPTAITGMKTLTYCDISSNYSTNSDVQCNRIRQLPVALAFTRLRELKLDGNPIVDPPKAIWTQGIGAIKSFMRALLPGGDMMRADTVNMLGDTGAGKTSLAQSLVARSPRPTAAADRTCVMQQHKMRLDEISGHGVYINDFGGHDIYHSVMPIFLPASGLLVLVFDMTLESQEERLKKWLLTAISKSKEIRIIIVGTHADQVEGDSKCSAWEKQMLEFSSNVFRRAVDEVRAHIRRLTSGTENSGVTGKLSRLQNLSLNLQNAIYRVVALSCNVLHEGLATLRKLTVELLRPPEVLPASWCRVINDLMIKSNDCLYLTMTQVREVSKAHLDSEDESAVVVVLRYLAKTSQILWIEEHTRLRDCVFIPPQKIIDVCKKILHHDSRAANLQSNYKKEMVDYEKGILAESLLRELLDDDRKRLSGRAENILSAPSSFDVVVDFMQQFNLLSRFSKNSIGQRFVIPCKLAPEEPTESLALLRLGENCLNRVTMRLSFVGSVVPLSFFETTLSSMLTVAGTNLHSCIKLWKYGLIIVHDGVYFLAKLESSNITFLAYSKPDAASPWTILQPVLQRLHNDIVWSWPGAPPDCTIECPLCARRYSSEDLKSDATQIEVDLSLLASHEGENLPRLTCPTCMEAIPRSLCFPITSNDSIAEEQQQLRNFFEHNTQKRMRTAEEGESSSKRIKGDVSIMDGNMGCSELVRRLIMVLPQLAQKLDRHSIDFIVDNLLAARDGCGLITHSHRQEIEAEITDYGKARKLLHAVIDRGDEAILVLALSLKREGVQRPDLAKLILEPS